jgi:sugar phosphate isomerase/epimerase
MRSLTLGFLTIADVPPVDVVSAAAAAGFEGAGIRITGRHLSDPWFEVLNDPPMIDEIVSRARTNGVRLSNISAYYLDGRTTMEHLAPILDIVYRMGSDLIVQGCFDPDESRLVATLAAYSEAARQRGIRIGVEFMPASTVRTLTDAQRILAAAGQPNLGFVLDPLHLARSGAKPSDIARINPNSIMLAQICDAAKQKPPEIDYMTEALTRRLYPGEGALPLADYVVAVGARTEIECETPHIRDRDLSARERARRSKNAADEFLLSLLSCRGAK